jgi:hypothetical protein
MFKEDLIFSIETYWAMQSVEDLQTRVAMNRTSSRDPLVKAGLGVNIAGEPGFTASMLLSQTEKMILARLGDYLVRDQVEAGWLVYIAASGDSLARLAQAAEKPDEWLLIARRRIDRFSAEHHVSNRPRL